MGRMIVKQPDGLYSMFSTIVDDYVFTNATPEELIEALIEDERFKITEMVTNAVNFINSPQTKSDHHNFSPKHATASWEETEKTRKMVHGE